MMIVPTKPLPSQDITVSLADQSCLIELRQNTFGLFMNLYVNDALIIGGVICQNLNRIVRSAYLGFVGDLAFIDNMGTSDPYYTGLGDRYSLAYLSAAEVAAL